MDDDTKSCLILIALAILGLGIFYGYRELRKPHGDEIGMVAKELYYVGHALAGESEQPVNDEEDLFDGDSVSVTNGGKARLTFGGITLFATNDTDLEKIFIEGDPQAPAIVNILLRLGGVIGEVAQPGQDLSLTTPVDGKIINIISTKFFMAYDPSSELTIVGNFEGKVTVDAGGERTEIDSGYYVVVPPNQAAGIQRPIPLSYDEFLSHVDDGNSALKTIAGYGMLSPTEIVWAVVPPGDTDTFSSGFEELSAMIYAQSGIVVEPYYAADYDEVIELLCSSAGETIVATLPAIPYLEAADRGCAEVSLISRRFDSPIYNSMFIAHVESGIQSMRDLRGLSYCFPDLNSTSGWIIPRLSLLASGIDPENAFYSLTETGSHRETVTAVYNYHCEAGSTYFDARADVVNDYPDIYEMVNIIDLSPDIPNDGIHFQPGVDDDLRASFVDALVAVAETEAGQDLIYAMFGWEGVEAQSDSFYDPLRKLLHSAGVTAADIEH